MPNRGIMDMGTMVVMCHMLCSIVFNQSFRVAIDDSIFNRCFIPTSIYFGLLN
jgi:hypothetical protein